LNLSNIFAHNSNLFAMNDFYKRIESLSKRAGYKSINDLAKNGLGYNSSEKLNRLKKPNTKPSVDILIDISNKFENINMNWLLTGKGSVFFEDKSDFSSVDILDNLSAEDIYTYLYKNEERRNFHESPAYNMYSEIKIQRGVIDYLEEQRKEKERNLHQKQN